MPVAISAREANHHFSRILREVEGGAEFGVPVARIMPAQPPGERRLSPEQEAILDRSMARLRRGRPLGGGRIERDRLHER